MQSGDRRAGDPLSSVEHALQWPLNLDIRLDSAGMTAREKLLADALKTSFSSAGVKAVGDGVFMIPT